MNLVKVGGSLYISTTANNHCGHGFYQFSPELFFSLLTKERGFELKSVIIKVHPFPGAEYGNPKFYEVSNPKSVKRRVGLVSRRPVMIMVHATKTKHVDLNAIPYPIQSDYVVRHADASTSSGTSPGFIQVAKSILGVFPKPISDRCIGLAQRLMYSTANKAFYKRWKLPY